MSESVKKEKNTKYFEYFDSDEAKIKAFDMIAEKYYDRNFGSLSKADFDVLMFSIYIERILDKSEEDMSTYSDYELSKQLGITQSRVRALKEKKQLQYPCDKFNWKESFKRIYQYARYDGKMICINVSDKNLFIELKNFVEEQHGYVNMRINSSIFAISPDCFFELLLRVASDDEGRLIEEKMREEYNKNSNIEKALTRPTVKQVTGALIGELGLEVLLTSVNLIPGIGSTLRAMIEKTIKIISN